MNLIIHKLLPYPILCLFMCFSEVLISQNDQSGYLVLNTNDTIYGKVVYIKEGGFGSDKFFNKIRLTDVNGKTKKFRRNKVKAFRSDGFVYEGFLLRSESMLLQTGDPLSMAYYPDSRKGEQHFLRIVTKGQLSHYRLEWFDDDNVMWSTSLFKKREDPYFVRVEQGLLGLKSKFLAKYFFDCPKLQEAIKQKVVNGASEVVEFYNANCK
ncbi:MAG: hypothetical protein AAF688_11055 [Bacteroidota bacterium]